MKKFSIALLGIAVLVVAGFALSNPTKTSSIVPPIGDANVASIVPPVGDTVVVTTTTATTTSA